MPHAFMLAQINMSNVITQLAKGFLPTVNIFFLTLLFSLPLGLVIAFARMSKISVIRWVTRLFISVMRGTPLMLQLFVVLYGPSYILNVSTPPSYRFYAVIIGFSVNYAAYFAEIYRGGIESVPLGQYEAASVLGFSRSQTFIKIILPQVMKNILPSITNETITLVKDTSLAFVISYAELFTAAKRMASLESSILPYFAAGVFYYFANLIVAFVMEHFEKKLRYYSIK